MCGATVIRRYDGWGGVGIYSDVTANRRLRFLGFARNDKPVCVSMGPRADGVPGWPRLRAPARPGAGLKPAATKAGGDDNPASVIPDRGRG